MTEKQARTNIRMALSLFKNQIRFPKIRVKDILESEDIRAIFKEIMAQKVQKVVSGQ